MTRMSSAARIRLLIDPQFLAAGFTALVVEVGLATTTLPRLARLLGVRLVGDDGDDGRRLVRAASPRDWYRRRRIAVDRVMRSWPFGDTCLRRALVLGHRIRPLRPVLVIGVRHDEGALAAHAWLVVGGVTLDPTASLYAPLIGDGGDA